MNAGWEGETGGEGRMGTEKGKGGRFIGRSGMWKRRGSETARPGGLEAGAASVGGGEQRQCSSEESWSARRNE